MVNFALPRNFLLLITETSLLEFRFEAFNLLNRIHSDGQAVHWHQQCRSE